MNKILKFAGKWAILGFDAMTAGAGVLLCITGISTFYSDYEKYSRK